MAFCPFCGNPVSEDFRFCPHCGKSQQLNSVTSGCLKIESKKIPGLFGKYEGTIVNGHPQGRGRIDYENGQFYEGEWNNGNKEGRGNYFWPDGHKYEGEWKEDSITGEGVMLFPDGAKYEGEFLNGQFNGHGILVENNGDRYSGNWSKGVLVGKYRVYLPPDGRLYLDCEEWDNGIHGVVTRNDGERYYYRNGRCILAKGKDGDVHFRYGATLTALIHYWEDSTYPAVIEGVFLQYKDASERHEYLKSNNHWTSEKYILRTVDLDPLFTLQSSTCHILLQSFMDSTRQPIIHACGSAKKDILGYCKGVDLRYSDREMDYNHNCCWQAIETAIIGFPVGLFDWPD